MKILILGHKGMLGHMVYKYFNEKTNYEILTINSRWSDEKFFRDVISFNGDYVVNCIGAIPQKTDDFVINYDLPIWLDKNINSKVIHPGTDCEMDNDYYGISKVNASDYIKNDGKRTKIIKTSIFGPELNGKSSLFEWFMNSENEVYGWSENYWSGITTLQWSIICHEMILSWDDYHLTNIPSTRCISKYELLNLIKDVFDKKIKIHKNGNVVANRCLKGTIEVKDITKQIVELKEFYYGN